MTTYTLVWTPDDSSESPVVLTMDSLSVARSTAADLISSYYGDCTATITDDAGNEYD